MNYSLSIVQWCTRIFSRNSQSLNQTSHLQISCYRCFADLKCFRRSLKCLICGESLIFCRFMQVLVAPYHRDSQSSSCLPHQRRLQPEDHPAWPRRSDSVQTRWRNTRPTERTPQASESAWAAPSHRRNTPRWCHTEPLQDKQRHTHLRHAALDLKESTHSTTRTEHALGVDVSDAEPQACWEGADHDVKIKEEGNPGGRLMLRYGRDDRNMNLSIAAQKISDIKHTAWNIFPEMNTNIF